MFVCACCVRLHHLYAVTVHVPCMQEGEREEAREGGRVEVFACMCLVREVGCTHVSCY